MIEIELKKIEDFEILSVGDNLKIEFNSRYMVFSDYGVVVNDSVLGFCFKCEKTNSIFSYIQLLNNKSYTVYKIITAEFFKNTKIKIDSEEHYKYVLELAFKCGYRCNYNTDTSNTDKHFLYFCENKGVTFGIVDGSFNEHEHKEIFIPMPEEAKYTAEFFKNTKIRIESEEHSKYVQELAFGCGYRWIANNQRIANTEEPFLYFDKDKEINYGNLEINFNEQNEEEIFIPMPEERPHQINFNECHSYENIGILITMPEEEIKWPDDGRFTVRANKQFWYLHPNGCVYINDSDSGGYHSKDELKKHEDYAERPHQTEDRKVSVCTRDDLRLTVDKEVDHDLLELAYSLKFIIKRYKGKKLDESESKEFLKYVSELCEKVINKEVK